KHHPRFDAYTVVAGKRGQHLRQQQGVRVVDTKVELGLVRLPLEFATPLQPAAEPPLAARAGKVLDHEGRETTFSAHPLGLPLLLADLAEVAYGSTVGAGGQGRIGLERGGHIALANLLWTPSQFAAICPLLAQLGRVLVATW